MRVFAVLIAVLLGVTLAAAGGTEVQGKIKTFDAASKMITLEDGTQLSVSDDAKVQVDQLKPGASIKASYDEKDGKKVISNVEVTPQ
jgi:Cu/Ag efflux protein CusF